MSIPSEWSAFGLSGVATVAVTTTGSAGSASGTATIKGLRGLLTRRLLNWHASAPATSDITIVEAADDGSFTIYSTTNTVADADSPTSVGSTTTGNAAFDPVVTAPIYLRGGTITITVSQCDALTNAVIVTLATVD